MASIFMLVIDLAKIPKENSASIEQTNKGFDQPETFSTLESALYTGLAPLIFNFGLLIGLAPALLYMK
jgi:hypothetical protein